MTPVLAPPPPSETQVPSELVFPVRAPLRRWGADRPFAHRTPRGVVAASVVAHLVLVGAAVLFLRIGRESAGIPGAVAAAGEDSQLTYIDIGSATASGDAAQPAPPAGGETLDTAGARIPAPPIATRGAGSAAPLVLSRGARGGTGNPVVPAGAGMPGGTGSAAGGSGARAGGGAGGIFQPGYRDPRLHAPPQTPPPRREPTEHERYMAQLEARLGTANDSVAAEAQRARNALDWTVKDKNGKRWGVGPDGKVVLGGVEIPVPIRVPPGDRDKEDNAARRERERQAIRNDEATRERREVMQERIRATRERRDAERRKQREGGG